MEERIKSANLRIAYAPVSRFTIYISKILSSYLFMGITFTLDICIMQVFGFVNYGGKEHLFHVLLLMYCMLAFSVTLGGAVCVILRSEELTNKILTIIATAFAVFSGIFFPISSLGKTVSDFANLSPLKWVIDCAFQIIYDGVSSSYIPIISCLLICSFIFLFIINLFYRPEDYLK